MAFAEDVTDFIDPDDFAVVASIDGEPVNGIFDRAYVDVNGVDSLRPTFYCALDDVLSITQGVTVDVNSENFKVLDVQREDLFVLLVLKNA
jgi:hypothetical protein